MVSSKVVYSLQILLLHMIIVELCLCLVRIIYFLSALHCHLMTQLANQPGFGWNSCKIFFSFFFFFFFFEGG